MTAFWHSSYLVDIQLAPIKLFCFVRSTEIYINTPKIALQSFFRVVVSYYRSYVPFNRPTLRAHTYFPHITKWGDRKCFTKPSSLPISSVCYVENFFHPAFHLYKAYMEILIVGLTQNINVIPESRFICSCHTLPKAIYASKQLNARLNMVWSLHNLCGHYRLSSHFQAGFSRLSQRFSLSRSE